VDVSVFGCFPGEVERVPFDGPKRGRIGESG